MKQDTFPAFSGLLFRYSKTEQTAILVCTALYHMSVQPCFSEFYKSFYYRFTGNIFLLIDIHSGILVFWPWHAGFVLTVSFSCFIRFCEKHCFRNESFGRNAMSLLTIFLFEHNHFPPLFGNPSFCSTWNIEVSTGKKQFLRPWVTESIRLFCFTAYGLRFKEVL